MSRVLYLEVPCFYAAVERAHDPSLADRPVVVGGDPRKGGRVQSASTEAQHAGVVPGMPMIEALERCPRARALRTDMARYRDASKRLQALFRRVLPRVESGRQLACAYADATALASPAAIARELCERVQRELALPLRVGLAPVRFVAQLAAEEGGAPGVHVVAPGGEAAFLAPLPVSRLPGIGPNAERRLTSLGVANVGDLARLDADLLDAEFGARGRSFRALARGQGEARVRAVAHRQSLSHEFTFESDQAEPGALVGRLAELARGLAQDLDLESLAARSVRLKLRYADGEIVTRSTTLRAPVVASSAIQEIARGLLRRTDVGLREVRLVGLSLSSLVPRGAEARQLELFSQ